MSIKKEVGQATWDSWPVGARMAIERLEPLLAALMLALDIIQRPEVRPYVSLDERDIIRDSANAEAHGRAVARTVQPLVGSLDGDK